MQHTLRTIRRRRNPARQLLGRSRIFAGPFLALSSLVGPAAAQGPVGSWSDEFDRPGLHGGWIWALGHYQGDLVAGGEGFFEADGESFGLIARFDGTHWQPIGPRLDGWIVHSFAEFQGELHAGGHLTQAVVPRQHLARWGGSAWQAVGGGLDGAPRSLFPDDAGGHLYAAGGFTHAGGSPSWYFARWDTEPGTVGTAFCFGDGTGSVCPCGNTGGTGEGCANSSGAGGLVSASGSDSVAADDLIFNASNLPPSQPALLFVALNPINGSNGNPFGDGLLCIGDGVVRLEVRTPDASGSATWGPGLGVQGGWSAGDGRRFQVWYRDPNGSPCGTFFNLSNALGVTFTP